MAELVVDRLTRTIGGNMSRYELVQGDCVAVLNSYAPNIFDACVCDPPYGLEFMGRSWDRLGAGGISKPGIGERETAWVDNRGWNERRCLNCGYLPSGASKCHCDAPLFGVDSSRWRAMQAWHEEWARAVWRSLKPGAYLLAFGGSRTFHRMACAIEDAGFELRDTLMWLHGQGFPKGKNGCSCKPPAPAYDDDWGWVRCGNCDGAIGSGTALKPAFEPIVMARKPMAGTVSDNMNRHGTGALNIDACRIDAGPEGVPFRGGFFGGSFGDGKSKVQPNLTGGRWPANLILGCACDEGQGDRHDENCPVAIMDAQSGGASRFFYCAKASRAERNAGTEDMPEKTKPGNRIGSPDLSGKFPDHDHRKSGGNNHPTVKPVALMSWLVRMVTPPYGVVLDPFVGSGTTGVAVMGEPDMGFFGIDADETEGYLRIADQRIGYAERGAK